VYNTSDSAPRGYYWLDHDVRDRALNLGEWVVFSPPEPVRRLMSERNYLRGATTLLKPVAALPGDWVCTDNRLVTVGGVAFGDVRPTDSHGRPLPWYRHCAAVPAGDLFVLSRKKGSFDSRYFGPLPFGSVIARATPLWTS
jgi:conjugative transfer signal peptidase TraF